MKAVEAMKSVKPSEVAIVEAMKSIKPSEVAVVEAAKAGCRVFHGSTLHRHSAQRTWHRSAVHWHPPHRTWHESATRSHPGHRITVPPHLRRSSQGCENACCHETKENEFSPVHSVIGFKKLNPSGFEKY